MTWKVNFKNAPFSGHVQHRQASAVRLDGAPRDGKAEAQSTPVEAALRERLDRERARRADSRNLPERLLEFARRVGVEYDTRPIAREEWDAASGDQR